MHATANVLVSRSGRNWQCFEEVKISTWILECF